MKPKRIQRKRSKGWRMPENTIYVGRPGKWGNPFKLVQDQIMCNASYRRAILSPWVIFDHDCLYSPELGLKQVLSLYKLWIQGYVFRDYKNCHITPVAKITDYEIKKELKGKDLACWCPEGSPCHADELLRIAN